MEYYSPEKVNEEVKLENSNKNLVTLQPSGLYGWRGKQGFSVQTRAKLKASGRNRPCHEEGIIHFHDSIILQ